MCESCGGESCVVDEWGESGRSKVGKVDGPSKVDGPAERGRSWVKVDGPNVEKWTVRK